MALHIRLYHRQYRHPRQYHRHRHHLLRRHRHDQNIISPPLRAVVAVVVAAVVVMMEGAHHIIAVVAPMRRQRKEMATHLLTTQPAIVFPTMALPAPVLVPAAPVLAPAPMLLPIPPTPTAPVKDTSTVASKCSFILAMTLPWCHYSERWGCIMGHGLRTLLISHWR